jgi:hypothetical protein
MQPRNHALQATSKMPKANVWHAKVDANPALQLTTASNVKKVSNGLPPRTMPVLSIVTLLVSTTKMVYSNAVHPKQVR